MKSAKFKGYLAIIITAIIWGISFVSIEKTVHIFQPMTLGLFRFIIGSGLLYAYGKSKGILQPLARKDLPLMIVAGFVGITIYFYFENNGVRYTSASSASLIISTIPIFTAVFEAMVFKTKVLKKTYFALMLSIIGVWLVSGISFSMVASGSARGYFMMFGAVISWAVYAIASKALFDKYDQFTIVFYQSVIGMLFFIPFSLVEKVAWSQISLESLLHLVFLGIFASAVGFFLYLYAMDKLGIPVSSIFLNMIPLVTVVFSVFYLGEEIGTMKWIGGSIILASVYIASYERKSIAKLTGEISR